MNARFEEDRGEWDREWIVTEALRVPYPRSYFAIYVPECCSLVAVAKVDREVEPMEKFTISMSPITLE